jgi:hypothetical protein
MNAPMVRRLSTGTTARRVARVVPGRVSKMPVDQPNPAATVSRATSIGRR